LVFKRQFRGRFFCALFRAVTGLPTEQVKSGNTKHMTEKLVTIGELSKLKNISERTLRTLMKRGLIPYLKLGFRTIRFYPSRVDAALLRREIKAKGERQ
jgi:excisionase family DNA binding protein